MKTFPLHLRFKQSFGILFNAQFNIRNYEVRRDEWPPNKLMRHIAARSEPIFLASRAHEASRVGGTRAAADGTKNAEFVPMCASITFRWTLRLSPARAEESKETQKSGKQRRRERKRALNSQVSGLYFTCCHLAQIFIIDFRYTRA